MWAEIIDTSAKSAGWKVADKIANELGNGWIVTKEDPEIGTSEVTVASISNNGYDTSMTITSQDRYITLYYNCGGQKINASEAQLRANYLANIIGLEIYNSPKGTAFAIGLRDFMNNKETLNYIVAKNAKGEDAVLTAGKPSTSSSDTNKTRITVVKKGFINSYYYPSTEISDIQRNSNIVIINKMVDWNAICMYEELYEIRMCPRGKRKLFEIKGKKYIAFTTEENCYGGIAFQVSN